MLLPRIALAASLLWMLSVLPVAAAHQHSVDLEIECMGGCTLRVHQRFYRDCNGPAVVSFPIAISPISGGCAAPTLLSPGLVMVGITDLSPICPSAVSICQSPSGITPGVEEHHVYRDYSTCGLSASCVFEAQSSICCRVPANTAGSANEGAFVSLQFEIGNTCNNSPVFTQAPLFVGCSGMVQQHHLGAYDPDGDSLAYELSTCMQNQTQPATYNAGYSPLSPLGPNWAVSLDPVTGLLTLLPQPGTPEIAPICILVKEYRNGVLIGKVQRDMQIVLANYCTGTPTAPSLAGISNPQGCVQVGPATLAACPGDSLCFDITATDPDTLLGQTLQLYWLAPLPGAQFVDAHNPAITDTVSGFSPDARFCWRAPSTPGLYHLMVRLKDNTCPLPLYRDEAIFIQVGTASALSVTSSGTLDYCSATPETITATPGYGAYSWSNGATSSTIIVNTPGTYIVTASSSCITATDSVQVAAPAPIDLSGTILDHLNLPLAQQRVWLIGHDTATHSLFLLDSTFTDNAGYYQFCQVSADTAWVKAAPSLAAYPNDLPTYADTALWWSAARPVPATQFPAIVSFSTRFGANPGGTGFIGGLVTQGANKTAAPGDPVPGLNMLIYSVSLGEFVGHAVSGQNGYVSFPNLSPGDYTFFPDKPGVSTTNVPTITLSAAHMVMDSVDFRLHSTYLEIVEPVLGQDRPGLSGFALSIGPNPATSQLDLSLGMPANGRVHWRILGLDGKSLAGGTLELASGLHSMTIPTAGLAQGTYFVEASHEGQVKREKVVILR